MKPVLHALVSAIFVYLFRAPNSKKPELIMASVASKPAKFVAFAVAYIVSTYDLYLGALIAATLYIANNDLQLVGT